MSPCPTRLDALLEADTDVLEGRADTELARHVRTCAACGAFAATVLSRSGALDRVLAGSGSADSGLVDAVLTQATRPDTDPTTARRHAGRPWALLMAAAGLAALLLAPEPELPGVAIETPDRLQGGVQVPDGRDVAVLHTDDPDIPVLGFY